MKLIGTTFFIAMLGGLCFLFYRGPLSLLQDYAGKTLHLIEKPNSENSPKIDINLERIRKEKNNAELIANQTQKTTSIISRLNSEYISTHERKELENKINTLNELRTRKLEQELAEILQKFDQLELDQKMLLEKHGIKKR